MCKGKAWFTLTRVTCTVPHEYMYFMFQTLKITETEYNCIDACDNLTVVIYAVHGAAG